MTRFGKMTTVATTLPFFPPSPSPSSPPPAQSSGLQWQVLMALALFAISDLRLSGSVNRKEVGNELVHFFPSIVSSVSQAVTQPSSHFLPTSCYIGRHRRRRYVPIGSWGTFVWLMVKGLGELKDDAETAFWTGIPVSFFLTEFLTAILWVPHAADKSGRRPALAVSLAARHHSVSLYMGCHDVQLARAADRRGRWIGCWEIREDPNRSVRGYRGGLH
ncbi:hypothetical protein FB45DRAFT_944094, partial [Roridomyces roridus]